MVCAPRFDYARGKHSVEIDHDGALFVSDGLTLRLRTPAPLEVKRVGEHDAVVADFTLSAGESLWFVLEEASEDSPAKDPHFVSQSFKETVNYWQNWMGRSTYRGLWRAEVNRSALALKLLTYAPAGSVVAAATFGLPEEIGGERNWDYRYTWIRDASVYALCGSRGLGYTDEMAAFMSWISQALRRAGGRPSFSKSCTASAARTSCPKKRWSILRATAARAPCASATPPTTSSSSTSTAALMDSVLPF